MNAKVGLNTDPTLTTTMLSLVDGLSQGSSQGSVNLNSHQNLKFPFMFNLLNSQPIYLNISESYPCVPFAIPNEIIGQDYCNFAKAVKGKSDLLEKPRAP